MEEIEYEVKVPARHSGRCFGIIKEFGKIKGDRWASDGSLEAAVMVTPALKEKFFTSVGRASDGTATIREKAKNDAKR